MFVYLINSQILKSLTPNLEELFIKMEVSKVCALCCSLLKPIQFNLKNVNSEHSHTTLISIVEKVAGQLLYNQHFNVCLQCYNLINELDAIELRQIEIHNQFKTYVEKSKENCSVTTKEDVMSTLENNIINEISDINLFNCNDDIKANLNNDILTGVPYLKSSIECFNSELTDIKLDDYVGNGTKLDQFKEPTAKKKEKQTKNPNISKPYICHCSKEFRTSGELKNHMKSHNNYHPFICEICGQSYKHKAAFTIHMDMHNGINPFTCVYCNKSFTQKGALVRHVPIHTGEKLYQCDECGKRFIHHTSFNVHRLSHTGQKAYKCALCGLALMSGSHLKRHMRIHTGEKKFCCSVCGQRFAEKYNLAVHEKLHSNPGSNVSRKRKFSCQICTTSFERKSKLDDHLSKEHETVKPEFKTDLLDNADS